MAFDGTTKINHQCPSSEVIARGRIIGNLECAEQTRKAHRAPTLSPHARGRRHTDVQPKHGMNASTADARDTKEF